MRAVAGAALAVACLAGGVPALAGECPLLDSFQDFEGLIGSSAGLPLEQRVALLNREFVSRHAELYSEEVLGLEPGEPLNVRLRAVLKDTDAQSTWPAAHAATLAALPTVNARFGEHFPHFKCRFPIYLTASLGTLDGAGRLVDGAPALVLGLDSIALLERPEALPVFLSHELFHRYHYQASGFSDDPGARQEIWRALWAEGLATYVSAQVNPDRPLTDAWLLPKELEDRAKPKLPELAHELRINLDRIDAAVYARFFMYGTKDAAMRGWPFRSGYYVGYRVAKELSTRHSLDALAQLRGKSLRNEIETVLLQLEQP